MWSWAWVMLIGAVIGLPIAVLSPLERPISAGAVAIVIFSDSGYTGGLLTAYSALRIGKVSIVAPIVATEGAIAAVIAVALGDVIGPVAAAMLAIIAIGVVLSARSPGKTDVAAGEFDVVADAIDEPPPVGAPPTPDERAIDAQGEAPILAIAAALVFGVALVASGKAASLVPVTWVALTARIVAMGVVVLPLALPGADAHDSARAALDPDRRAGRVLRGDLARLRVARQRRHRRGHGFAVRGRCGCCRVPVVQGADRVASNSSASSWSWPASASSLPSRPDPRGLRVRLVGCGVRVRANRRLRLSRSRLTRYTAAS